MHGNDDDTHARTFGLYGARGGEPIHLGHAHVHQHEIRLKAPGQRQRLSPVRRLADDLQAALASEHAPQTGAREIMIVDDHQPSRRRGPRSVAIGGSHPTIC